MKNHNFRIITILILLCIANFLQAANITILPYNDSQAALNFIKPLLPENPVILEAGAFDGTDSVRMSKFWPKATLHSFEPVPGINKLLQAKTKAFKNINCYQYALSDKNGTAKFHVSKTPEGDLYGSSSLLPAKDHLNYYPYNFKEEITVETLTLDSWAKKFNIKHLDFMWLDMQGYELPTLKASTEILKTVKVIYVEAINIEAYAGQFTYKDITVWLENNGFKMVAKDLANFSKDFWFCNCVFIKR